MGVLRQVAIHGPDRVVHSAVAERPDYVLVERQLDPHPRVVNVHRLKHPLEPVKGARFGELRPRQAMHARRCLVRKESPALDPIPDGFPGDPQKLGNLLRAVGAARAPEQVASGRAKLVNMPPSGCRPLFELLHHALYERPLLFI